VHELPHPHLLIEMQATAHKHRHPGGGESPVSFKRFR
jgi:hypothetical protein